MTVGRITGASENHLLLKLHKEMWLYTASVWPSFAIQGGASRTYKGELAFLRIALESWQCWGAALPILTKKFWGSNRDWERHDSVKMACDHFNKEPSSTSISFTPKTNNLAFHLVLSVRELREGLPLPKGQTMQHHSSRSSLQSLTARSNVQQHTYLGQTLGASLKSVPHIPVRGTK